MKKITIIGLLSLCAAGAYAQGQLNFFNDQNLSVITHIYSPQLATPTVETTGQAPNDYPTGSTVYTGTPIGGSLGTGAATVNYANGNWFSVSIYALGVEDGLNDGNNNSLYHAAATLFSSLVPVTTYSSTLTTSGTFAPGLFLQQTSYPGGGADPGIPNTGYETSNAQLEPTAAVSVVCWYNAGGTITSYAAAVAADTAAGSYVDPYGHSTVFRLNNLGEPSSEIALNGSGSPTQPQNLTGLTSFSLLGIGSVPEPSTIALGVMGACAFLARRRKK